MAPPLRVAQPGPAVTRGAPIAFRFDGRSIDGFDGDSVCSALHAADERVLMRSIKYHRPRGYFCGIGKCASCLVRVDGAPNVRACVTPARDGMVVETQNAFPSARRDLFAIVDKVYRRNFDYHEKFIHPKSFRPLYNGVIRRMAGFGKLPDLKPKRPGRRPDITKRTVDVLVVGGGRSGLEAAATAAEAGVSVLLVEESDRLGGSMLFDPSGVQDAAALARRATDARAETVARAVAIGCYLTDGVGERLAAPGVVPVLREEGILEVRPTAIVVASGVHETPGLFPGNDLPGVMGARAARLLLHKHGVLAGARVALATPAARAAGEELAKAGAEVVAWGDAAVVEALGGTRVERVRLADGTVVACDAVLCAGDETPRVELLQQCGVPLVAKGWALVPDITRLPRGVLACGAVTAGAVEGAAAGEAAAKAVRL